jgi:hypothetical protein
MSQFRLKYLKQILTGADVQDWFLFPVKMITFLGLLPSPRPLCTDRPGDTVERRPPRCWARLCAPRRHWWHFLSPASRHEAAVRWHEAGDWSPWNLSCLPQRSPLSGLAPALCAYVACVLPCAHCHFPSIMWGKFYMKTCLVCGLQLSS